MSNPTEDVTPDTITTAHTDIAASFAANTGLQVFRGTMEVLKG